MSRYNRFTKNNTISQEIGYQPAPTPAPTSTTAQPGPTVHFNFKNDADMAFYILNAVCHDWIHDFNNYGRMGVILKYIDHLVNPTPESTSSSASAAPPVEDTSPSTLSNLVKGAGGGNTGGSSGKVIYNLSTPLQSPSATDPRAKSHFQYPDSPSATNESPKSEEESMDVDEVVIKIPIDQGVLNAIDSYIQIKTNYEEPDNRFVLQLLEEFIGECKLLVISKLTSGSPPNPPEDNPPEETQSTQFASQDLTPFTETQAFAASQISINNTFMQPLASSQDGSMDVNSDKPKGIFCVTEKDILSAIKNINDEIKDGYTNPVDEKWDEFMYKVKQPKVKQPDIPDRPSPTKRQRSEETISDESSPMDVDERNNKTDTMIDPEYKPKLLNLFSFLSKVFVKINFKTPISPLEKLNNSLINDILGSFIIGKDLKVKDDEKIIEEISQLFIKNIERLNILVPEETKSIDDITEQTQQEINHEELGGGGIFSKKLYESNTAIWANLEIAINRIKNNNNILYQLYKGDRKPPTANSDPQIPSYLNDLNDAYKMILDVDNTDLQPAIQIICGVGLKNSKMNMIENRQNSVNSSNPRIKIRNIQILTDTILSFVFEDIINPYEDIKARVQAEFVPDGSSMTPPQRKCVQKISQLVAKKTLGMSEIKLSNYNAAASTASATASTASTNSISDLEAQLIIIDGIANDGGYGSVDTKLIDYFNTYKGVKFIDTNKLETLIKTCKTRGSCRIINNAIQDIKIKQEIVGNVTCPTSSVCDGMGTFGSCFPPKNKEYYNMDFMISSPEGQTPNDETKFYEGKTTLTAKKDSVAIEYGFKFNNLQLYNFLKIDITSKPIVLEANYAFKGVINRILEIWKGAQTETKIEDLWDLLEKDAFFLSILQVGSQKAIGDIFQEVNSTLKNGGYSLLNNDRDKIEEINRRKTFGLMGDRPSGVRVVKLLKDGKIDDINQMACGGYVSEQGSLIYNNITYAQVVSGRSFGGMTQKKFKTKTNTRKKKNNKRRRSIKKSKKNNKNTRRFAN